MTEITEPNNVRQKLHLVFTGHVDHGKSTVIGRLLYDTGSLPEGTVTKIRRISAETGQPFEMAFLLDAFEEEQKQGITIDTTRLQFKTKKRDYVIIDAPGHKEFLKNMISGAADAEAAFLVIDAQRGVEEQSRRHALMLKLLGISRIGLIINKMDLVGFSQDVFQAVSAELTGFLESLGLSPQVTLPLAALSGENIVAHSQAMTWYHGPTLIEALDGLTKDEGGQGSLRLPLQAIYKFDDRRILAGRIESGQVSVGDEILISPGGKKTKVVSLAAWLDRDLKSQSGAGESVGLMVSDEFFNRRGEIVSLPGEPPAVSDRLRASIFWMGRNPLKIKRRYKLRLATSESEAEITEIVRLVDSETLAAQNGRNQAQSSSESPKTMVGVFGPGGQTQNAAKPISSGPEPSSSADDAHLKIEERTSGPEEVGFNQVAEVEILLQRQLAFDLFSRHRATGRFVLVDGFDVSGGGIVTEIFERLPVRFGFVGDGLRARCEVFEEYYYDISGMAVSKVTPKEPSYSLGDRVPLTGHSYRYPENFDIAVFRDRVAIRIRDGRVVSLLALQDYAYEGFPIVNGRGFGVLVNSERDWALVREDYDRLTTDNETALAERWLDFNTYRRIPMGGGEYSQELFE
ncbi:MAG: 50S ribosome-binding GTPase [Deltaproteobacteria bacterium]|nr:50S ribosome-binding GTPase [Deltaproteobacteria bacterium]